MYRYDAPGFRLRYQTWGDPTGRAVLFFHGFPGSHVQAGALAPLVRPHNIFLIAADRPGYGGTIGSGTREQYLDALANLLKELKVEKYDVVGVSGGAPWAHLMASRFVEHVRSMKIVCGLATYNKETREYFSKFQYRGLRLRGLVPAIGAEIFLNLAIGYFKPERRMARFMKMLNEADREVLSNPANHGLLMMSMHNAREQGAKGVVYDTALYMRDWLRKDCSLQRLQTIPTSYFHGLQDRILDPRMSSWMHEANKGSHIRLFENEGHYSLPFNQAGKILDWALSSHMEADF